MEGLDCIQCYLDTLLTLTNRSYEDYLNKIEWVMVCLQSVELKVRAKKCHFPMTELEYLGYYITCEEIKSTHKKKKQH